MQEIKTSIVINATPKDVWEAIIDFSNYSSWNRFIRKIWNFDSSRSLAGQTFWESVYILKGIFMPLPMKILNYEEQKELSFKGNIPWLFAIWSYGYHIFTLQELGNGQTEFQHRWIGSGLFMDIGIGITSIRREIQTGQIQMNNDLKTYVENQKNLKK